jgi:flavin reductase (DIM6/NTAB) family NADH-FMN oxidoreductase RutF
MPATSAGITTERFVQFSQSTRGVLFMTNKIDVRPEWWDNIFAPSSCLVIITTADKAGRVNAAAFGTCTRVCHDPMYISFTCGSGKDTYDNVLATGEFVVNVVPFEQTMLDKTLICGLPFRGGENELLKAGLTPLPSRKLKPPRIAECHSHFECKVEWTQAWLHRLMVCGKVEAVSIDEDCITQNGHIVWDKVKPAHYCGMRYQDRFVPAYDKPTRGVWRYDGRDEEFRPGEDWRNAHRSTD